MYLELHVNRVELFQVVNPMIHCCDKCLKPILIYGRMIPCKHVFCLTCAQSSEKTNCSRCGDKVIRVEQAGLGSIYMCSHGGSRYGHNGCRRTYLSQRDLQAHIQHRHMKSAALSASVPSAAAIAEATAAIANAQQQRKGFGSPPQTIRNPIPSAHLTTIPNNSNSRQSNLITVPIQDQPSNSDSSGYNNYYYNRNSGDQTSQFSHPPPSSSSSSTSGYYGQQGSEGSNWRTSGSSSVNSTNYYNRR